MAGQVAFFGNLVITVAYAAITVAIMVPLVRARQLTTNRLALATAMIFFSCAVGHAFHAAGYFAASVAAPASDTHHWSPWSAWSAWPSAVWDVVTAVVGTYYWTLRRGYGVLLGRGALFVDPYEQQRRRDIDVREQVAAGRAAAEAERDAQAAMLRAVIANSQSLIYVKDLDGRYLLANEAFERIIGVAERDLIGQTDEVVDPALAPVWRANDLQARTGATRMDEYADLPDGRHVFESVKFPLYDASGRMYAICGMSLDITALRRAMTEAEHARDEALAQSQVKSDFLATMSHEIRTPMNGVLGLSSLLLGTDLDPTQRRYAGSIHTAGNALLGVINDILDFSKIDAGRLELDPADFAIPTILDEVTALVAPAAAQKGLSLRTLHGTSLPARVCGDGGRLRQILLNLTGNAVKFTPEGGVTLCADLVSAPGEAPVVRFEVIDTGIGIPADTVDRLFQPFTQADASTTRTYGGTGLGLTISRRLAEAMGGTLGVDSRPGAGSRFWCVLPFAAASGDDPAHTPDISRLRILVVQAGDGPTSLGENLRHWRMSPTCTHSSAGALHALREAADRGRPYDVLIIDADTGVDPAALADAVAADTRVPTAHVVVLGADPTDLSRYGGRFTCLPKPVHRSQLFDMLARTILAVPAVRPRSAPPTTASPPAAGRTTRDDTAAGTTAADTTAAGTTAAGATAAGGTAADDVAGTGSADAGHRILLVEDNDINQLVAVGILSRLGHGCDVASDGLQALELAARHPYDIILMDCRMPRMDGFAATTELRRREGAARRTPVIAMTASALAADRERCLAAGMDDYLAKPVTLADLDEVLTRWLGDDDAAGTAPGAGTPAITSPATVPDPLLHRLEELAGERTAEELTVVAALITSFLQRMPRHLAALQEAVAADDAELVEDRAHTLAGAAGNIGAESVAQLCQRLESRGRDRDVAAATGDLQALHTEAERVDRRLRGILTGRDTPASSGRDTPASSGAPDAAAGQP